MSEPQTALGIRSDRHENILSALKGIVNDLTGLSVDEVDVHGSYLDAGVDSLLLIQLSQAIQNQFEIKLSLIQLLEELTTLDTIAEYLDSQLPQESFRAATPSQPEPQVVSAVTEPRPAPEPVQYVEPQPARVAAAQRAIEPLPKERELREQTTVISNTYSPRPASASGIERIIEHQLQIMSQQLNVLRPARFGIASGANSDQRVEPVYEQTMPTAKQSSAQPSPDAIKPADAPAVESARPQNATPKVKPGPAKITPELFTPYKPFQSSPTKGLSPIQQAYLERFIARYNERTKESKRFAQQYRPYLADSRNNAGFRLALKEMIYQIVGMRSQGSRMWDVDGNEYVDITMGFGVHLFGHSPGFLVEALQEQSELGMHLGPQVYLSGQAAQLVCELTGFDRAMFCNSGTEAVMAAMRAARTYTHRNKIAIFAGGYHGWSDGTLAKPMFAEGQLRAVPAVPGVPQSAVDDLLVLDFDSPESLEILRKHAGELAAIMLEPVQSRRPDVQPRAFLHELRRIADESGAVLIFDEMVTGFRVHPGGAAAVFGVQADIATYGKVVGGGLPIGVIAGKTEFMGALDGGLWNYGDGSYPTSERTLFAGAFFKHPLTMAATVASLTHIKNNTPSLHHQLNDRSSRMARALNEYFESKEVPVRLVNFGSLFRFLFPADLKFSDLFFYHMNEKGAFMWEGGTCFLSTAHTDEDVNFVIKAVKQTVEEMQEGGFLPSTPPDGPGGGSRSVGPSTALSESGIATVPTRPATAEPAKAQARNDSGSSRAASGTVNFSVYYFGKYESEFRGDKYDLLWQGARFADKNGFEAVWVPERHFHEFGGFSPNPSVLAAALARETERVKIRAGSVVLPLHNPIRIAEEWAIVDNISKGRVGISFASGYRPDDFVFYPEAYENRRNIVAEGIELVHKLWRGETVQVRAGGGSNPNIKLFPMPMQPTLPTWLTSNHKDTFIKAGELGIGILTNLHDQTIEEMTVKIAAYREALARSGHDADRGQVTVLLHTFLSDDVERARQIARNPFFEYLRTSFSLLRNVAESQGKKVDFNKLTDAEMDYLLGAAYDRYIQSGALIGTPQSCFAIVDKLIGIGVNEIGCLIDFGVSTPLALEGLHYLNLLKQHYASRDSLSQNQGQHRTIQSEREESTEIVIQSVAGKASREDAQGVIRFPLTEGQRQLWTLAQMGPVASRAFNESLRLDMRGPLDIEAMRNALQRVVDRHEALRTTFSPNGDYQQIYSKVNLQVPVSDFSQLDEQGREMEVEKLIASEAQLPFDFERGPMLRAHIAILGSDHHLLTLTIHHIAVDGWSLSILLNEIREFYSSERQGDLCRLPEPMTYREYVDWQSRQQQSSQSESDEAYWVNKYADSFPVLSLPLDRPRPRVRTFEGDRLRMKLDAQLFEGLKKLCARRRSTMFMTTMAAFELMLHRLTGEDDIVIGTPLAGQSVVDGKDLVGFCINDVAIRSRLTRDVPFTEFLAGVKSEIINAYDHQNYSFSHLVKRLNLARPPSHPPLISAVFILDKAGPKLRFHDVEVEPDSNPTRGARVDFHWNVIEHEDHLLLESAFSTDLFDAGTILRWMKHYETLLKAIVANPQRRLSEISLLTEAEQRELLVDWNVTDAEYPRHKSIEKLFEAQADQSPDRNAVEFQGQTLSYRELNGRANRLAQYLAENRVGAEVIVGICMERSVEMLVGMLAVLKAGGAYLPLDPTYPIERLNYMLGDSGVEVVLSHRAIAHKLADYNGRVVCVDEEWSEIAKLSDADQEPKADAGNLAYIIYTSGSTGTPKGVMVRRNSLVNHALALSRIQNLNGNDRHLQFITTSLDASMEEIYPALISGATLIMHRSPAELSAEEFLSLLEESRVTVAHIPAAYWQQWIDILKPGERPILPNLRLLLTGGESTSLRKLEDFARLTNYRVRFVNAYGPTEATITSTTFETLTDREAIASLTKLPIGRPIDNARIYLLDKNLQPVPVGVAGELYIGGEGVARGYLKRVDLTAERFVSDPFASQSGARIYRTGDLARYLPNGQIEFVGRADNQAKVRGYRIELGEIEVALASNPAIGECVALIRDDLDEHKRLVAYITVKNGQPPTANELRSFLKEKLPEHMVPAWFVTLDSFPMTPSGKLDRRALPKPDDARPELHAEYVAPGTDFERQIAGIWQGLLGIEKVGMNDNFFDLGGHSLLVVQVCAKLREALGREIEVIELFQYPTISSLASHLSPGQVETSPLEDARPGSEDQKETVSVQKPLVEKHEGIAIIAMAGRFPGAINVEEFWRNLQDGAEGITFFSDEEMIDAGIDPSLLQDPKYVKAAGVLKDADMFDASFFGYSPREAEVIDPQHRLFLESAWQALETAGYDPETFGGPIGVYAGASMNTYLLSNIILNSEALASAGSFQTHIGSDKDFLPTRVSYKLNLRGPSLAVQTACSTSLVAVHLACQALQNGECNMALAGGASVSVPQQEGYIYQEGGILSPDGHCRAFDMDAHGTIGGSGVGVVVLKRLADAVADGDRIYGVIKGTAINNDGSFKIGYTAPSIQGQAEVIAMAQAAAGVQPESISYIEAHGTGTPLGDPIEIAALNQVFKARTDKKRFCAIGSVKTNVGHLDAAAGVTGLIKTALALYNKKLPPSLHYTSPNPKIDFANSPFFVNTTLREWESESMLRRAGVSSFGIGGTNAHAVLEEAPPSEPSDPSRPWQLLTLSARTAGALDQMAANLADHLKQNPDISLADVAYTLQVGRRAFNHRRVIVCRDIDDAVNALENRVTNRVKSSVYEGRQPSVVFMFSGQGAQYAGMARELYGSSEVFKDHLDMCARLLKAHLGFDLKEVLFPAESNREEATERLKQTFITQPALFAVEYALAKMWMEWGVKPEAMIGHSIGEYVAACLAGVMTIEEAIDIVATRGRLMQEMPAGSMLAVALSEEEIQWMLGDRLSLAAINGPRLCVVSGPADAIEEFEKSLGDGVWMKRLETSHAFHSAMMEPMLQPFTEAMGRVQLKEPQIPFISNLTGTGIKKREAVDPRYWADHLREAVRFADGINELLKKPGRVLLEIGPGHTLTTMVKRIAGKGSSATLVQSLSEPGEQNSDLAAVLTALGRLWLNGVKVNWQGLHAGERRRREPLPTYPFERKRFWIEKPAASASEIAQTTVAKALADWFYVPSWKRSPLGLRFDSASLANRSLIWLLMVDDQGVGNELAERLEGERQQVIRVEASSRFEKFSDKSYCINPLGEDDLRLLVDGVRQNTGRPERIIHLWNLTSEPEEESLAAGFEDRASEGFYSLLGLARMFGSSDDSPRVRIDIVTNNAQDVLGEERIDPEKAPVLAASRVIPREHANIACKVIDITSTESETRERARIVEQLLAELIADYDEPPVAFRGNHRWAQTYEPVRMEATAGETALKQGGVYLITGAMGKAGLALAESLIEEFSARLVLTERLDIFEWADRIEDVEDLRKMKRVERLRARAESVLMMKADPASESDMREAVSLAKHHFGTLNGVIHAAGGQYRSAIQPDTQPNRGTLNGDFSAKAKGAQVLQRILKDEKIDFLVLCSSHRSLLGAAGEMDACAGDAYLDALAHRCSATSEKQIVSINWEPREAAIVNDESAPESVIDANMNSRYGEVFDRVLKSGLPQVIVSALDFRQIIERGAALADQYALDSAEQNQSSLKQPERRAAHPRQLSTPYEAPSTKAERAIAAIWSDLLGVEEVGRRDNYFELGGDSIIALQIILRASQSGFEFSPQDLFQYQTVAELALLVEQPQPVEQDQTVALAESMGADITDQVKSATASPAPSDFHRVRIDKQGLDNILKKINKAKK